MSIRISYRGPCCFDGDVNNTEIYFCLRGNEPWGRTHREEGSYHSLGVPYLPIPRRALVIRSTFQVARWKKGKEEDTCFFFFQRHFQRRLALHKLAQNQMAFTPRKAKSVFLIGETMNPAKTQAFFLSFFSSSFFCFFFFISAIPQGKC